MVEALEENGPRQGPAVPRHLCRHAAHGRARPRITGDRGFRLIRGEVDKITPSDPSLKIPHMGWNTLSAQGSHKLLDGIPLGPDGLHAYFVHS